MSEDEEIRCFGCGVVVPDRMPYVRLTGTASIQGRSDIVATAYDIRCDACRAERNNP